MVGQDRAVGVESWNLFKALTDVQDDQPASLGRGLIP